MTVNQTIEAIAVHGIGILAPLAKSALESNALTLGRFAVSDRERGTVRRNTRHLLELVELHERTGYGNHCQGEDYLRSARGGHPIPPCRGGVRTPSQYELLEDAELIARAAWVIKTGTVADALREFVGAITNKL